MRVEGPYKALLHLSGSQLVTGNSGQLRLACLQSWRTLAFMLPVRWKDVSLKVIISTPHLMTSLFLPCYAVSCTGVRQSVAK